MKNAGSDCPLNKIHINCTVPYHSSFSPVSKVVCMRTPGLLHRFVSLIYRTICTPGVISPEMFISWRREPDFVILQRCADYAYQNRIPVRAADTYYLDRSISLRGIRWEGGIFVGDTPVYLDDASLENTEFNGSHVEIQEDAAQFAIIFFTIRRRPQPC